MATFLYPSMKDDGTLAWSVQALQVPVTHLWCQHGWPRIERLESSSLLTVGSGMLRVASGVIFGPAGKIKPAHFSPQTSLD